MSRMAQGQNTSHLHLQTGHHCKHQLALDLCESICLKCIEVSICFLVLLNLTLTLSNAAGAVTDLSQNEVTNAPVFNINFSEADIILFTGFLQQHTNPIGLAW